MFQATKLAIIMDRLRRYHNDVEENEFTNDHGKEYLRALCELATYDRDSVIRLVSGIIQVCT